MSNNQTQVNPFEVEPEEESSENLSPVDIQNRIIAYISLGKTSLSEDFSIEIDDATRSKFIKDVASGEISDQRFQDLMTDLLAIDTSEDKELVAMYDAQIDILKEEAMETHPELRLQKAKEETATVLAAVRDESGREVIPGNNISIYDKRSIAEETAQDHNNVDKNGVGKLEMVYEDQARQIVNSVEDDEDGDDSKFHIDKELLIENDLIPRHRFQIGPSIIYFSSGCDLGNGYTAVIGYIETGGKVKVQTYYTDNEMGVWQYANEDIHSPDGRGTRVPIAEQQLLSKITSSDQPKINVKNAQQIFPEIMAKNVP